MLITTICLITMKILLYFAQADQEKGANLHG